MSPRDSGPSEGLGCKDMKTISWMSVLASANLPQGNAPSRIIAQRPMASAREDGSSRHAQILLVENAGSFLGGGQVSFFQLATHLDRDRYDPMVVCPEPGDFYHAALEHGLHAELHPMPRLKGLGWLRFPTTVPSWLRLLHRHDIDLLHINGTRAMLYAGVAARMARRPVIWHVRVLDEHGTDRALDRILVRLATRVVVNSRAVAERFTALSSSGLQSAPLVIPNGVDIETFAAATAQPDLRCRWELEGKLVLLTLAQLIPWKRQHLAIDVLHEVRRRGIDAVLVLVGDEVPDSAGYRRELEERTVSRGLAAHCVFAGYRRDVPSLLKQADLLLHTARNEPFGRALIEAMASGLAILASAGGGVPDIVKDGVTGVLVDSDDPQVWADHVVELARDPGRRRAMARAGLDRARAHFSLESHVDRVETVYDAILARSR